MMKLFTCVERQITSSDHFVIRTAKLSLNRGHLHKPPGSSSRRSNYLLPL